MENLQRKNLFYREEAIKNTKRVLIKVGTRLLTDISRIPKLMEQIYNLKKKGYQVILVSSGAVGIGMRVLNLTKRPSQLSKVQALASIGQGKLMKQYEKAAQCFGFHTGQLLLTMTGVSDRGRHLNMLNCLNSLLEMNVLPIVNENDSVSVKELTFGDNDQLAVLVSAMTRCDTTIFLTTVDGLRRIENSKLKDRIPYITELTTEIKEMAMGTDDTQNSIGGMESKLKAAEISMTTGNYLFIADGKNFNTIDKIFNIEDTGTLFIPQRKNKMPSRKSWLSFFSKVNGQVFIDDGAVKAVTERGKSLLPSGIISIKGEFKRGDTVEIISAGSRKRVAKGLINYDSSKASKLCGLNSSKIKVVLGYNGDDELIHRDNLVLG
ncbi:MAG: glutamate 5-kinase [Victivallales bacterium]|nr:glutamate 5-kinase [Victivallales bacterium]MCF7889163.1 glutamate 5-kinase [Victivallales bacterium]